MISTFWFLIKSAIIVTALAWVLNLGGGVSVNAFGYEVATSLGVFVIIAIIGLYALSLVFRTIRAIIFSPKTIAESLQKNAHKTGMQSLTYGLSAVAAGDAKAATYYTKKATKLLKDDYGLVALLSGLTARLKGDEKQAETSFKTLLKRDETSFLGIRGLLQTALDRGDDRYARVLARQAYEANPKQAWIIKTLYDLEVKHQDFDGAYPLLKKGIKAGAFTKDEARAHEAAMDLVNKDVIHAYKMAPNFLPAALAVLKLWSSEGRRRKCINLIKKIWVHNPHPDLVDFWISLKKSDDAGRIMAWVEDLQRLNPESAAANLYTANIALRYQLNAQAKRFLELAIAAKPTMRAYQLMSRVEPMDGWQDLVPKGTADKAWVCTLSGKIYDVWQPLNDLGDFNTIEWMYPDDRQSVDMHHARPQSFFLTETKAA